MVQQVLVRGGMLRVRLRSMTSSDRNNDLVTSQEKLEWVTPKISLMDAEDTEGNKNLLRQAEFRPSLEGPS